jgi:hypothetical protein
VTVLGGREWLRAGTRPSRLVASQIRKRALVDVRRCDQPWSCINRVELDCCLMSRRTFFDDELCYSTVRRLQFSVEARTPLAQVSALLLQQEQVTPSQRST